jgi:hypothetical protein
MSNTDWDSKTVIGYKPKVSKVARKDTELNSTSFLQTYATFKLVTFPFSIG